MSQKETGSKLAMYVSGFVLSIVLTLVAYGLATRHTLVAGGLMAILLGLAVLQFLVQMFFFLHLGSERKPRWRQLTVVLMVTIALIVVVGSIWVMYNLNYRMMPDQINQYMQKQAQSGL